MTGYKSRNRGFMKLQVWQDAIDYYRSSCAVFKGFPFELKKVASNHIDSCDSIHRNIAEGYCRRSTREYISFLKIAQGSLGESVSGIHACFHAKQISEADHRVLDEKAFKIENELLRLVESLERRIQRGLVAGEKEPAPTDEDLSVPPDPSPQ